MEKAFNRLATVVSHAAGRPWAFVLCLSAVLTWAITGAIFHYSETWQLIINTGTTIVTFLMVFLIQNTQNRDGAAIQAKLDELIRVSEGRNHFIGIEHLTESEVEEIRLKCEQAAKRAEKRIVKDEGQIAEKAAERAVAKATDAGSRRRTAGKGGKRAA